MYTGVIESLTKLICNSSGIGVTASLHFNTRYNCCHVTTFWNLIGSCRRSNSLNSQKLPGHFSYSMLVRLNTLLGTCTCEGVITVAFQWCSLIAAGNSLTDVQWLRLSHHGCKTIWSGFLQLVCGHSVQLARYEVMGEYSCRCTLTKPYRCMQSHKQGRRGGWVCPRACGPLWNWREW